MGLMDKIFGTHSQHELKRIYPIVDRIEALEPEMKALSDAELKDKTREFKERLKEGETLDDILPEAYAVVREGAYRSMGMRHYRVQLERLIYTIAGQDGQKNAELMDALKSSGAYEITKEMKAKLDDFVGGYATEEQTAQAIHDTYKRTGYVMDTHTAVASCVCAQYREESGDETKCLIASTASPYKFVGSVMRAIDAEYAGRDEFELVDELEKLSQVAVPNAVKEIRDAKILHTRECDADKMKETVKEILEIEV